MYSEEFIRSTLTLQKYNKWLKKYKKDMSCGTHTMFVLEQLDIQGHDYAQFYTINLSNIDTFMKLLENGHMLNLFHNYNKNVELYQKKPLHYGNHEFVIIPTTNNNFFVTQAYQFAYSHSLRLYTKLEIIQMLEDIITKMSDYDNNKKWKDIDFRLHRKYFRTDLLMYPDKLPNLNDKVHNIVLKVEIY